MDNSQQNSYVDSYVPPATTPAVASLPNVFDDQSLASSSVSAPPQIEDHSTAPSQALEDQNIFHMLGIAEAPDSDKEAFLDELQQVIWEDFLENDVELLITEEENVGFQQIVNKAELTEEQRQSEMMDYLEKLIPDLEKIMLEKALELKEEMMRERLDQYMKLYEQNPEILEKVMSAKKMASDQQWFSASELLNTLPR